MPLWTYRYQDQGRRYHEAAWSGINKPPAIDTFRVTNGFDLEVQYLDMFMMFDVHADNYTLRDHEFGSDTVPPRKAFRQCWIR